MNAEIEKLSYCGLDCTTCDVYKYTLTGKSDNFDKMVTTWSRTARKHWGMASLDPKMLHCKGCRYDGEDGFHSTKVCPIRKCAIKKGLKSCGLCAKLDKCSIISGLLNDCLDARKNLNNLKSM